jgi:hypothetical protein
MNWAEIRSAKMKIEYVYFIIPLIAIGIVPQFDFLFPSIDTDSARNMISALVQSEAAIMAIVVSLSLVAVQLAASVYSIRIIKIFKRMSLYWFLIYYYILSMGYGLWVIIGIRKADLGSDVLAFLRADIYLSYFLGIYAFILLAIYIRNVLDLLDLTKILDILSRDVTREEILSVERSGDMNDPLKPIVDIIISSMNRFDEGGIEEGLSLIEETIIELLDKHDFNEMEQKKLSAILFPHLEIIFNLALNKKDESICDKLINVVEAIGKRSAERDCFIAYESAQFLGRAGKKAAEIKDPLFDDIIINIVLALTSIGEKAAIKNSETVANASMSLLGAIAEIAKDRSKIIGIIDEGLGSIGNASENGTIQKAGREASQAISPSGQ